MQDDSRQTLTGSLYALAAYGAWGLSPLFWKQLAHVPALEVLGHRVFFSMFFLLFLLAVSRRLGELKLLFTGRRMVLTFALSGLLIGSNWFLFIYSVATDQVLQASLGYFMNPLFNVVLGMVFLGERLRRWQWLAVTLATVGVILLAVLTGGVPWIALVLMCSFGFYGLVRKTAPVGALLGSTFETGMLIPAGGLYLIYLTQSGQAHYPELDTTSWIFLFFTGAMTAGPLLWFANAARRLTLTTLGFFQYLAPSGQFLLAVLLYNEPFTRIQLTSFLCIWTALAIFTLELWLHRRGVAKG